MQGKKTKQKHTERTDFLRTMRLLPKKGIIIIKLEHRKQNKDKEIFEVIMTKNFSKLMADNKPQIKEVQRTQQNAARHMIFKHHKPQKK